jgi:hypothetical protein
MKNSCEGVTDESAILAFIDSLERGQLLRHRLLQERNKGKLTLNSMITIASNYAAADDDARESLKVHHPEYWKAEQQQKEQPA